MTKVLLKELCSLEKGKQIDTNLLNDSNAYKYINGGTKESGFYNEFNTTGETVIVSEGGASCGYVNYVNEPFWCGCHCYRLTNIKVNAKYLFYLLKGNQKNIMDLRTGAAMPNIKKSSFEYLELNVDFNKDNQLAVVNDLSHIENALEIKNNQLLALDELIKSRFIEMFEENNKHNFPVKPLSEIATYWNGLTYKPTDVVNDENGTLVLRSSNIQNGQLSFDDNVYVNCSIKEKQYVKENDILMCSRNGSAKLVGKVALIKGLDKPTSFGAFMMIFRSEYYSYLKVYFEMPEFRSQLATGTSTINQITGGMLNGVKLPVPDMDTVNEFKTFVEQIDKSKFVCHSKYFL